MAPVRLLIVAACVGCFASVRPSAAGEAAVVVPKWAKVAAAGHGAHRLASRMDDAVHVVMSGRPIPALIHVGTMAVEARHLIRANQALLTGRKGGGLPRIKGGGTLITSAFVAYDVAAGRADSYQLTRTAAELGISIAAGSLATSSFFVIAGTFGTAGTGTAIGSLSGAAFTSSALAWAGGGSLAAGGGGVALGSLVVSGGVAIVAIAATYGAVKVWDMADRSERDGFNKYVAALLARPDLTDADCDLGAAIAYETRKIAEIQRRSQRPFNDTH